MAKVIRVALVNQKTKRFIEYLVDTGNYKIADDIAKGQARLDGYDLNEFSSVVMAEMEVLNAAE